MILVKLPSKKNTHKIYYQKDRRAMCTYHGAAQQAHFLFKINKDGM